MVERPHESTPGAHRADEPPSPPPRARTEQDLRGRLLREVRDLRVQLVDLAGRLHDAHLEQETVRREHEDDLRELALLRVRLRGRQVALAVLVVTGIAAVAVRTLVSRVTTADDVHVLAAAVTCIPGLTLAARAVDAGRRATQVPTLRPLIGPRRMPPPPPPAPDVTVMSDAERREWVARARAVRTVRSYREVFGPDE